MAGYNFPDSPFVGENFAPPNGPSWQWDGNVWKVSSIAPPLEAPEVAVGDNLPTVGSWNGQLWWESDTGKLFVWFDDGSSAQWVQIIAPTLILDATDSLVKATGGNVLRPLSDWFAGMGRDDNPPELGFWPDQADANIWRMRDRIFVGDASDYDGNKTQANGSWLGEPQTAPDDGNINQHWLESSAQLYSNHTQGGIAILGATRVGDQGGLVGHTAIGVAGYAYANQNPGNVWGGYFEGVRDSVSTNAIFGLQASAKNLGELKTSSPYEMFVPGGTYGIWVAAGGRSVAEPSATAPSSAAISIGSGTSRWVKGIVFGANGLEGTDGLNAGKAVAIEMGMGQAIKWRHALEQYSTSGEIRSDNNEAASETRIVFDPAGLLIKCMDSSQTNEVKIAEFPINATAGIYPSLQSGMAGIHLVAVGDNANGHVNLTPKGTGVVVTHASIQMNSTEAPTPGGEFGTGLMLGNVPNFGVHFGSGIPLIVARQGSLYLRTDGPANERLYVNEDSGARWKALLDDVTGKVDVAHIGSGGDAHAAAIPVGNVTVPAGLNGFLTGADKAKLDGILTVVPNGVPGLIPGADKTKLDGILPVIPNGAPGLIIGTDKVKLDQMVDVTPDGGSGFMTSADKAKLDSIAVVIPGGIPGLMTGEDKTKLDYVPDELALVIPEGDPGLMSGGDKTKLDAMLLGAGIFVDRLYTTAGSHTWTRMTGLIGLEVWVQAGGGGGGGVTAIAAESAHGSGGGGGAYGYQSYDTTAIASMASVSLTVGTGGSGGISNNGPGGNGGLSSFGTLSCSGGLGGAVLISGATVAMVAGGLGGATIGGAQVTMNGSYGQAAIRIATPVTAASIGGGGGAAGGGCGGAPPTATAGLAAGSGSSGSGGAGGFSYNNTGASTGGSGGVGFVRVREYY